MHRAVSRVGCKEEAALRVWKTRWVADDAADGPDDKRGATGLMNESG